MAELYNIWDYVNDYHADIGVTEQNASLTQKNGQNL